MSKNTKVKLSHWADQTAEKIIRTRGDMESYTCASGITPSGTVHIGNFREIISVDLIVRALRARGKKVRFIYSWDNYDVFRKVPKNMPKQDVLKEYLRFPITMVPDVTGRTKSYARHNEVDVESTLPLVGIFPEFLYQAELYRTNKYTEGIKTALDNREKIKECLNHYRDDSHKMAADEEYWPTAIFCSKCHKDTTKMHSFDGDYRLAYKCSSCGNNETVDIRTSPDVKLGWRVDWPMRWKTENTIFEPAGKDHHSQGGSFDTAKLIAKEVYKFDPPETFRYDFIGLKGLPGKMSSSSGNVIDLGQVLKVYQPEIVRYMFAGTRPNTEFNISFDLDVIKTYEDYDKMERLVFGVQSAKNEKVLEKQKRIWELSQVAENAEDWPAMISYQLSFRHLCNMLQASSGDIDAVIASLKDIKPEQVERLKARCVCAWYWITECAPDDFKFQLQNPKKDDFVKAKIPEAERHCIKKIYTDILPTMDEVDEKSFSQSLYAVAKTCDIESRQLFSACYLILVGKEKGPRLAGFMKMIGKKRLTALFAEYV
ncbi:MAG TPA: lysine--tRNA ligase [Treponemataceae bacterium]|nr:lysine--tRNA ligase [Treponemataceae bacterium]